MGHLTDSAGPGAAQSLNALFGHFWASLRDANTVGPEECDLDNWQSSHCEYVIPLFPLLSFWLWCSTQ